MSWYVVILMWLLYLAMRDLTPSPTPWEIEEAAETCPRNFSDGSLKRRDHTRYPLVN
jgi:hypothetical protein